MWLALGCGFGAACALVVAGAGVRMVWRVLAGVVLVAAVLAALVVAMVGGKDSPVWAAASGAMFGFVCSLAIEALRVGWAAIVRHYRAGSNR